MRIFPYIMLLLAVSACRDATGPALPVQAVPLEPVPDVYESWWSQMESCSGHTRPAGGVRWYYVPWPYLVEVGHEYTIGAWLGRPDRIVIMEVHIDTDVLIRHEMLHALLQRADHPAEFFEDRCGELLY